MVVRYDTPDENGETRRVRNEKFGAPSPELQVPDEAAHVWDWFWTLSARRRSGPEAISYAEIGEWQRLAGMPVRPEEVEMLIQMDNAYLDEVGLEQRAQAERARDRQKGASRG